MKNDVKEFLTEKAKGMAKQAKKFRESPLEAAREAGAKSAEAIKSLNDPIRTFARSGVKLTAISQGTAQSLIELQTEIVTSALSQAATQLERVARTVSVTDMVRDQSDVLKAAGERIVDDMSKAVKILRDAGGDVRKVATDAYAKVTKPAAAPAKTKKAGAKAKRPARKVARKARK